MIKLQTLFKYLTCQNFILYGSGGGGGGQPTSTTSTTNTSNIPPYAQPYVENMLAATQAQLFQTTPGGTDAQGIQYKTLLGLILIKLTVQPMQMVIQ